MATQSNVSLIARGIYEVREGNAISEGGIVILTEGIMDSWRSPMRWSYGKGDNEVSGVSCIAEMFQGRHHPDGSADSKFLPAMYLAVAENYGIEGGFADADKQAFKRAHMIAGAAFGGAPVEFKDVVVKRKGKDAKVRAAVVPASVAFKLTDAEGKPTSIATDAVEAQKSNLRLFNQPIPEDDKLLEMVSALPVECVGGKHAVFGKVPSATGLANTLRPIAVAAGYMDAPKPRNGSARSAKFEEALEYVASCLDLFASGKDESEFAPCDALESKMRSVAERIAAYFAA